MLKTPPKFLVTKNIFGWKTRYFLVNDIENKCKNERWYELANKREKKAEISTIVTFTYFLEQHLDINII